MKRPPANSELFDAMEPCVMALFGKMNAETLLDAAQIMSVVDEKGRYLHWNDILNRTQHADKAKAKWSLIKFARRVVLKPIPRLNKALGNIALFTLLPSMQKTCSLIDRHCTDAGLQDLINNIGIPGYYLHDYIDAESIASSQLEGASTTRAVARQMLAEKRSGRTESEKMILGNQRLMSLAYESRYDTMSMELFLQFHEEATRGIDDAKYQPGEVRTTNDVWVEGRDGNVVHTPPGAEILPAKLDQFIAWLNYEHEEGLSPNTYLHPVIKACMLHFCIGYLHPFRDGNGRVARALCYWFLFKQGYEAFLYISISQLLKEAPVQYGEAYLKTETDNLDVTYFVEYQCQILERAVKGIIEHAKSVATNLREFDNWVFASGIRKKMPDIQQKILNIAVMSPGENFTIKGFADRAGISESAARLHMEKLADAGILLKSGGGGSKPIFYSPRTSFSKIKTALIELYK